MTQLMIHSNSTIHQRKGRPAVVSTGDKVVWPDGAVSMPAYEGLTHKDWKLSPVKDTTRVPKDHEVTEVTYVMDKGKPTKNITTALKTVSPSEVRAEADRRIEALSKGYSRTERDTWATQVEEAKQVQADPTATPPFISARATWRGVTITEYATLVMDKHQNLAGKRGAIYGAMDALIASKPIPLDYNLNKHWPA